MRLRGLLTMAAFAVAATGCVSRDPQGLIQKSSAYKEAESLFLDGQYRQARVKFLAVQNSDVPNDKKWNLEARFYAARCDHLLGDIVPAVAVYNDILRTPRYRRLEVQALAARGDISLETGQYEGAARDYGRARSLLESGWVGDAGKTFDREKLLFAEGKALYSLGRTRDSDLAFDRYMTEYPEGRFIREAKACHTRLGTGRRQVTRFYVMVGGLFRVEGLAESLAKELRGKGYADVSVEPRESASGFVYVVKVGSFDSYPEAHEQRAVLQKAGYSPAEVRP